MPEIKQSEAFPAGLQRASQMYDQASQERKGSEPTLKSVCFSNWSKLLAPCQLLLVPRCFSLEENSHVLAQELGTPIVQVSGRQLRRSLASVSPETSRQMASMKRLVKAVRMMHSGYMYGLLLCARALPLLYHI